MSELAFSAVAVTGIFLLAAMAQAITGFGSSLVIVPLLTFLTDPVTAVVAATVASAVLAGAAATRERHLIDRESAVRLTLTALWGMPFGLVVLTFVEPGPLGRVIGLVLLVLVPVVTFQPVRPTSRAGMRSLGVVSGAFLTSTAMNGPPLILALRGLAPGRFRATLQAVFVGQDLVAIALLAALGHVSPEALFIALTGAIVMPLGWLAGDRVFAHVDHARLRVIIFVGLMVTALVMLLG